MIFFRVFIEPIFSNSRSFDACIYIYIFFFCRRPVQLELRCPHSVDGIAIDPEPNWSFDSVLSELNSLEKKLNASSVPVPFTKAKSRYCIVIGSALCLYTA